MRRDISITLSDPDDRTAAEALLGLGKAQKQQEGQLPLHVTHASYP